MIDLSYFVTFENCFNLVLGSCDVVTITFGSSTPAHRYSSSCAETTPFVQNRFEFNLKIKQICFLITFASSVVPISLLLKFQGVFAKIRRNFAVFYEKILFPSFEQKHFLFLPSIASFKRFFLSSIVFCRCSTDFR